MCLRRVGFNFNIYIGVHLVLIFWCVVGQFEFFLCSLVILVSVKLGSYYYIYSAVAHYGGIIFTMMFTVTYLWMC